MTSSLALITETIRVAGVSFSTPLLLLVEVLKRKETVPFTTLELITSTSLEQFHRNIAETTARYINFFMTNFYIVQI